MESANGSRMECLDLIGKKLSESDLKDKIIRFCLFKGHDQLYTRGMLTLARMNGQISDAEFDPEAYEDIEHKDLCPELATLAGSQDICKLCKFSFDYFNDNIHSEYTVLSYILKSKENLKEFKRTGLKADVFRSYMVFNGVPIPLHKIIFDCLGENYESTRTILFKQLETDYPALHMLSSDIPLFFRRMYENDCSIDTFFMAVSKLSGAPCYLDGPPPPEDSTTLIDVYEVGHGVEQFGIIDAALRKTAMRTPIPAQNAVKVRRTRKAFNEPHPLVGQETFLPENTNSSVIASSVLMDVPPQCPPHLTPLDDSPLDAVQLSEAFLTVTPITVESNAETIHPPLPSTVDPINTEERPSSNTRVTELSGNTIKLLTSDDFHRYLSTVHCQSVLFVESVGRRILISWGDCLDILELDICHSWAQIEISLIMRSSIEKVSLESMSIRSLLNSYGIPCRNLNGIMTLYHCWRYSGRPASPEAAVKDLTGHSLDDSDSWYNRVIMVMPLYGRMWKTLKNYKISFRDFGIYDRESAFESLAATAYAHIESSPYPRKAHFGYKRSSTPLQDGETTLAARCANLDELLATSDVLQSPMGYELDKSRYGEELFRRFGAELMAKDLLGKSQVRLLDYTHNTISLACPKTFYRVLLDVLNHTLDARMHDSSPSFRSIIEIE